MSKRKQGNDTPSDEHIIKDPRVSKSKLDNITSRSAFNANVVLDTNQQLIYDAVISNKFEELRGLVTKYLYSIDNNKHFNIINVRATLDICDNMKLLARHTQIKCRDCDWQCCSLCGYPIKKNEMQIEHTVPSTSFYLILTRKFFNEDAGDACAPVPKISDDIFNNIMCNNFDEIDDEEYDDIHLAVATSCIACNQAKESKVMVTLTIDENGVVQMTPNTAVIRLFADMFGIVQSNNVGYITAGRFNTLANTKFEVTPRLVDRPDIVFVKTLGFITELCRKYNYNRYHCSEIMSNIYNLRECKIKHYKGKYNIIDLLYLNYERIMHDQSFMMYLIHNEHIVQINKPIVRPRLNPRTPKPTVHARGDTPEYKIWVPPIVLSNDAAIQDNQVALYIEDLFAKFQVHLVQMETGEGIRKNKPTKTKKNKNNKTRRNNKPYKTNPKSQRNKLKSKKQKRI